MQAKQEDVQTVERKKEQADDVLKDKKKEAGKISRELAKIEQDIREVVGFLRRRKCVGSILLIIAFHSLRKPK